MRRMAATTLRRPPVPAPGGSGAKIVPAQIPLSMVADVRIVEGPSMIKSENGLLRSYVQLNVRDRDHDRLCRRSPPRRRGASETAAPACTWNGPASSNIKCTPAAR